MTNDERFANWWAEHGDDFIAAKRLPSRYEAAQAAWRAACLPDKVLETCISALRAVESEYEGCPSFRDWVSACAAARIHLEGA